MKLTKEGRERLMFYTDEEVGHVIKHELEAILLSILNLT